MEKKKKEFNLRREYKECWNYICNSKNFIYIVIAIFFAFVLIGFFIPAPDYIVEQIMRFIEEILEKTEGLSQFQLVKFIFFNNLRSSFFGMSFGILFGIFPILVTVINGYLLGFVSALSVSSEGILSLWRLLPHGIFELPAIFLSLGLGLRLGTFVFQQNKRKFFKENILKILKVFLLVVIPLLIIAAIIEGILVAVTG